MKRYASVALLSAIFILVAWLATSHVDFDLEAELVGPVVRVELEEGNGGSGTVVGQDRVLTCAHVVWDKDLTELEVDGKPATLIKVDLINDLAVLAVPGLGRRPALLAEEFPRLRLERVWAVGYPYLITKVVTEGSVGAPGVVTAPIAPGNSGGGVFVLRHGIVYLVGISAAMGWNGNPRYPPAMHVVKVIPAEMIRDFLGREP